jgi:hypothetical protein
MRFEVRIRCQLRAGVKGSSRRFPDVDSSCMSGFVGHLRTVVEVGVGSSHHRPDRIAACRSFPFSSP